MHIMNITTINILITDCNVDKIIDQFTKLQVMIPY